MRLKHVVFATLVTALVPVAPAQQRSTLSKVVFRNGGSFAQADLESVAGMHAGDKVSLEQIRGAAQRLVDTGFFDDVKVDSTGSPAALTIVYILKPLPPEQLATVAFDNFIWLTPEELRGLVRSTVPLFRDQLPESGASLETIRTALKAAVAAKGVPGAEVTYEPVLPTSADPVHSLHFRVTSPAVLVYSVTIEGEPAALVPEVNRLAAKQRGASYVSGETMSATLGAELAPLRDAGYLQAHASEVQVSVAKSSPQAVMVDVHARVESGASYHVEAVQFEATPLVDETAFQAGAKLHAGDLASAKVLAATLEPVEVVYHKAGYMEEYVDPGAGLNEAAHTVTYRLKVVPGEPFHVKSVTVLGLSPAQKALFDGTWRMQPGDLYNADYVRKFLTSNTAVRGLEGLTGGFRAESDPQTHLVDLTVTFVRVNGGR